MQRQTIVGLLDELEKLALAPCKKCGNRTRDQRCGICDHCAFPKEKTAFLRNLGRGVTRFGAGVANNVGNAVGSFGAPVHSFKQGLKETFAPRGKPIGNGTKLWLGATAALGAHGAIKKEDPLGQGRSRTHRALSLIGDQVGGIIAAPYGLSGSIAGGMIGGGVGNAAGRLVDKVRGYKPRPQQEQG